ncbi:MAG: cation diffusion facilitator family transporter [Candidatus Omnitrophota bacterium]
MNTDLNQFLINRAGLGNSPDASDPKVRRRCGYLEGWVSIVVNLALFLIKIIIGFLSGSISVIADAVHTASDVSTSIVVIIGFNISNKPADEDHPFGHGRMEDIATLIIAVLLCVVGAEIFKVAALRFFAPPPVRANLYLAAILALTALVKEWMARFSFRLAKLIDSSTLYADAWHHRSDAISTLFVIGAIIGTIFKLFKLDAVFGAMVAVYIIYTALKLIRESSFHLLGKAVDEALHNKIKQLSLSVKGVEGVHDIVAHDYGTLKAISLHVEVDNRLDVAAAHKIATLVETKIAKNINSSPIVHIDLKKKKKTKFSSKYIKKLRGIIRNFSQIINSHGVQVSSGESGDSLNLHIVVSKHMNIEDSHKLEHDLAAAIKVEFADYDIHIHVEPCEISCTSCRLSCKD